MKLIRPPRAYSSIEEFYAEVPDIDRRLSGELDYGVFWTADPHSGWPLHRVSYVKRTGELYVTKLRTPYPLHVIAVMDAEAEAEYALTAWADHCGPGGLIWLHRRLEELVPTYYCVACFRGGGHTEITHDPRERCPRCSRRRWDETPDSRQRADRRRTMRLVVGARS